MDSPSLNKQDCRKCPGYKGCRDAFSSWVFLFIGLIATVSIRLVNVVLGISELWAKLLWYIGIAGFLVYFLYKFRQENLAKKELLRLRLKEKLHSSGELDCEEREFISAILCRIGSQKDLINYFFIFFTSGIALLLGIYQDFIRP